MFTLLMPTPKQQFFSLLGLPLIGGKVYTYAAGTSMPKATYTDEAGTTPQANPIVLNTRGEPASAIRWVGAYRVEVRDALDNLVYTVDDFQTPASSDELMSDAGAGLIGFDYAEAYPLGTVGRWLVDLALSTGSGLIGFLQAGAGAVARSVQDRLRESVSIKDFGAVGDGVTDDTAAILACKTYALANLPMTVTAPKGTFLYTDIGNWAYGGLGLKGKSHRETVFKCTTTAPALMVDAFQPGLTGNDATAPFAQAMNVRNITFEGKSTALKILDLQGLARCAWRNVFARNCDSAAGIAVHMRGCMLSSFYNLGCSTDMDTMASIPYEGLRMDPGSRNGISVGNASNNCFTNPYFEGLQVGIRLSGADQNIFNSGSAESSGVYDVLVGAASRYNTFNGVGFESLTVTANVSDAGVYTKYINCYGNKKILLQGRGAVIDGGYYQRIEIQGGATKNIVQNITLEHWETTFPGTGGFFDSGTATEWKNLYSELAGAYTYPYNSRTAIVVGASPFVWQNTTGQFVDVILQTGTVTQIRTLRTTDGWLCPIAIPGRHLLAPSDTIEVSYSVIPQMSYVPYNGFQG